MRHLAIRFLCALAFFFRAACSHGADLAGDSIRFGSVAEDIPAVMHQRLIPLTNYLSDAVGKHVVLKLSPDMPGAIAALAAGDVELAYLTPVAYIRSHESGNTRLLVKTVTDNQGFFRLMIVVRSDSPIKTVADLAGKRFAFGDPAALLQLAVVANAGVNMDKLGTRAYLGHYDNIVRGILNRDYDAGIVTDMKVHRWAGKGLRVIYSSPELPPYNIAATHKLDDALFTKLQKALLRLDSKNPQDRQVLSALGEDYNGFAPTSDHEYDIVRDLIKPFRQ
jgi:phosphonate transport system substrate-binding protein